ncbi:hypothetical protein [Brevundimonas sp.]|uniref:hypothetical protein n=1 Tax=Brevundimonas sp. TaxID=1871086 RepID=UPI002FC99E7A
MTPEQKLQALFAAEAPPARDYAFQAQLAQRIALRRAWMTVAALVPWGVAGIAILWALIPVVGPLGEDIAALVPAAGMLGVAALSAVAARWLSRRFSAA